MTRPGKFPLFLMVSTVLYLASSGGASGAPKPEEERAWIEPVGPNSTNSITIQVPCPAPMPVSEPLTLSCEMTSRLTINEGMLLVQIFDVSGTLLHSYETKLLLGPEKRVYPVAWDASGAAPGVYRAQFSVLRAPRIEVASRPYVIKKARWSELLALRDTAAAALEKLTGFATESSYAKMRVAVAKAALERAGRAVEDSDWMLLDHLVRYLGKADESIRALLVFGNTVPELSRPVAYGDAEKLAIRDGSFYSGDRPVFLMGKYFGTDWQTDAGRIRDWGLNFAVVTVNPSHTLVSPEPPGVIPPGLASWFEQARSRNIHVMAAFDLHDLPQWAVEKWPFLRDSGLGKTDVVKPEARALIEQHVRLIIPWLAGRQALAGLDVFHTPAFKFTGEEVRRGFLERVRGKYPDRHAVNQAWRGLFADLNEIAIGWDEVNPRYQTTSAYQYDWQTYHQELAGDYLAALAAVIRGMAGDLPLGVALPENVLEPGESKRGLNCEDLQRLFELDGCTSTTMQFDPLYGMQYPGAALLYTLLHSLAPGKPLVNFCNRIITQAAGEEPCTFNYVHAVMWDSAVAGLAASALFAEDAAASPECLEAYATASLDLNRLAPMVAAFQRAPADVRILWSEPSRIYDNGSPYLPSVRHAYEGSSFSGHKVAFITEREIADGKLQDVKVLVLPETPAVFDSTFEAIKEYTLQGGVILRPSTQIQFNESGHTRRDVISVSRNTILVRIENEANGYLGAMDAVTDFNVLPDIPRAITNYGYPLEGVRSRYAECDGRRYLYLLNVRRDPVMAAIRGGFPGGRDLIHGYDIKFPMALPPLTPFLIQLDEPPAPPPTPEAAPGS